MTPNPDTREEWEPSSGYVGLEQAFAEVETKWREAERRVRQLALALAKSEAEAERLEGEYEYRTETAERRAQELESELVECVPRIEARQEIADRRVQELEAYIEGATPPITDEEVERAAEAGQELANHWGHQPGSDSWAKTVARAALEAARKR